MKKFNFNGYDLEYFEKNTNKNKNMIFIHGFGSNVNFFDSLINEFCDEYNIFGLNMPAHGNSEYDNKLMNFETFCEIFRQFLNFLDLRNVTLIGHSLGGGIAGANLINSHQVKKCILIGPMNRTSLAKVKEFNDCFFPTNLNEWEKLIRLCYFNPDSIISNQEIRKKTQQYFVENRVQIEYVYKLGKDLPSNKNMDLIENGLNKSNTKIGLFIGDHDGIIDLENIVPYYQNVVKNLKVYKINNAGHSIWLENWNDFVNKLHEFLNEL